MLKPSLPQLGLVECGQCGAIIPRRRLDQPECWRRSLRGIRHKAPGDCEPDEYVTICPDCGAPESFQDPIRCAECLYRPCACLPEAGGTD